MTAYLGNSEGNAWLLEKLTNRVCWLGLHITEPGPVGDTATEVAGGGYERQLIVFGAPSGKTVVSTNNQIFSGMPAAIIRWVAVWSGQFGGQMIAAISQDSPETVGVGQQYLGAPGDVAVTV